MEQVKIYLSGGMTGLSVDKQKRWRKQVSDAIKYGDYNYEKKPIFFDPTDYYMPNSSEHKSEKEAMEFDLNALRKSDLVIVNFNAPNSIGTAMELMLAKELHIPVVGINKDGYKLHSWLVECTTRMCDDMKELINHVVEFYLK